MGCRDSLFKSAYVQTALIIIIIIILLKQHEPLQPLQKTPPPKNQEAEGEAGFGDWWGVEGSGGGLGGLFGGAREAGPTGAGGEGAVVGTYLHSH